MIGKMLTNPRTFICKEYRLYCTYKRTSKAAGHYNQVKLRNCDNGIVCIYRAGFGGNLTRGLRTSIVRTEKIPSPRGLPVFGTLLSLIRAGGAAKLHEYVDGRHRNLGPVFKEKLGNVEAVFVSDPEYMRAVFAQEGKYPVHVLPEAWVLYNRLYGCSRGVFFMDGEEWLHNRRIMNDLLLKGDLSYIGNGCEIVARDTVKVLQDNDFDLNKVMYRWSLDTLVCVLLGSDVYEHNKTQFDAILKNLSETVHLIFETSAKLQLIPAVLAAKLKVRIWTEFVASVDNALSSANDLVQMLAHTFPNNTGLLGAMLRQNIPKSDIIKIISDLVLAAGDTTAYTMQWILYSLATNLQIQQDIYKHLESTNTNHTLKNFIRETLRLYPVAPFLTRILPNEAKIGPYTIPKNTLICMSLFTSGRDEKVFNEPSRFNPDRWLDKTPAMLQASLPFAMGSRSCIGRKIAEMQLQATLEEVVKNFHVEMKNDDDQIDVVLKMVAVPSQPLKLRFIKRL